MSSVRTLLSLAAAKNLYFHLPLFLLVLRLLALSRFILFFVFTETPLFVLILRKEIVTPMVDNPTIDPMMLVFPNTNIRNALNKADRDISAILREEKAAVETLISQSFANAELQSTLDDALNSLSVSRQKFRVVLEKNQELKDRDLEKNVIDELGLAALDVGNLDLILTSEFRGAKRVHGGLFCALNQQLRKAPLKSGSIQNARERERRLALEGGNQETAFNDDMVLEALGQRLPQQLQPLGASQFLRDFVEWVRQDFPCLLSQLYPPLIPGGPVDYNRTQLDPDQVMLELLFELIIGLWKRKKCREEREERIRRR